MNSQQQVRKAPFIYPEYLSQMTSKIKPKEERTPMFSSFNNHGLIHFPTQGLGDTTNIDDLKQAHSSSTSTTAGETTVTMPPKSPYIRAQSSNLTAASDPLPAQPLMFSPSMNNPMNRGMFMNRGMTSNFSMSNAFAGGLTNLFSRKPIIPEDSPPPPDDGGDDQSVTSTTSSTRRLLFPDNPIMLIPTPSKSSSTSPKRSSGSPSSVGTPNRPTTSPRLVPTIAPLPPPASPFKTIGKALRLTPAGTLVGNSSSSSSPPPSSASVASAPPTAPTTFQPTICTVIPPPAPSSNASVASTASNFSVTSAKARAALTQIKEPPKIRVKKNNSTSPKNNNKTCASCLCRDQKLVDQRKEIEHLKEVIQDLLVLSMESRSSNHSDYEDDDDSLEDLPPPLILQHRAPHRGDLLKAAEMALEPTRQSFEPDPEDPLAKDQVSSTTAMLKMSHSLQVKQAFKRGAASSIKALSKLRHLRIQVDGNWGYYSGPKPEADTQLVGCVVRFDNGDLYLGNMENSCFHGPGTYHPKGGKSFRGTFCWNKLVQDDENDDYSC